MTRAAPLAGPIATGPGLLARAARPGPVRGAERLGLGACLPDPLGAPGLLAGRPCGLLLERLDLGGQLPHRPGRSLPLLAEAGVHILQPPIHVPERVRVRPLRRRLGRRGFFDRGQQALHVVEPLEADLQVAELDDPLIDPRVDGHRLDPDQAGDDQRQVRRVQECAYPDSATRGVPGS